MMSFFHIETYMKLISQGTSGRIGSIPGNLSPSTFLPRSIQFSLFQSRRIWAAELYPNTYITFS